MKPFRMFIRGIRDAFKSVFRNFSLSIASITCITITLIVVAVSIIVSLNVNNISKTIKEDVTIVVFMKDDVDEISLNKTEEFLKSIDNINKDKIVKKTKDEIKKELASEESNIGTVVKNYPDDINPFKDTFQVTVKDITKIKDTVRQIKGIQYVYDAEYGEEMVNKVITVFNVVEKVSLIVVIALVIVTIFLIVNTIKLTIFSRKREISIMRLVGASNFTIKQPFVIEGMVLGILGSIIPIGLVIYGYFVLYNKMGGEMGSRLFKMVKPEPFVYIVALIILGIGIVVGMIGSYKAVRKYLKV